LVFTVIGSSGTLRFRRALVASVALGAITAAVVAMGAVTARSIELPQSDYVGRIEVDPETAIAFDMRPPSWAGQRSRRPRAEGEAGRAIAANPAAPVAGKSRAEAASAGGVP